MFQPDLYNRCHDVLMMSLNLTTINILNVHVVDYRYIISRIKKKRCNKLNAKYRFD